MSEEYYRNPQEVWCAAKCRKMANRTTTDGLGTPYPFKGYLHPPSPLGWGKIKYNGGCTRDGKWWQGEIFPIPQVADGYEIVHRPTWGMVIQRKADPQST